MKSAVIILAAGDSSRLGEPKQLLSFKGKTLLRHAVDTAMALHDSAILVVTGSQHEQLLPELEASTVTVVNNSAWKMGMSTSIVLGLTELLKMIPDCEACTLVVCDQPYLSTQILEKLVGAQRETGKGIAAAGYANTAGTPVLFTSLYFDVLLGLTGEQGARSIVKKYQEDLVIVPFPKGEIDIDTRQAYDDLLSLE